MSRKPIDPFAQRIVDFLDEVECPHSEIRFRGGTNNEIFTMHHGIELSKGRFYYELTGWTTERLLSLWTFPLLAIPEDRLVQAAEYALLANRNEWFGHFDLEYEPGGRIGFRTSLICETAEPGFAVLREWMFRNFGALMFHIPYIVSVLLDDVEPSKALAACNADRYSGGGE